MTRRDEPVEALVADLNDLAKQRGWKTHAWGNYGGYTEVLLDRDMTLDDLEAVAAALDATLTLEVRPKEAR